MPGIPAAHGPWNRQLLALLGDEVRDDLKGIREDAGIQRILRAEGRLTRQLTVGPNGLLDCTTEQERIYGQAVLRAVQLLTRAICNELTPPEEEHP